MKEIISENSPESNWKFRFQSTPSIPPEKNEKPKESTPKTTKKEVKKVKAQSGLGGGRFNPNINMPTGGVKDD